MNPTSTPADRLMWPHEVATVFRVDAKTVTRWAADGRLSSIRTPGGHRRFYETEVRAFLAGETTGMDVVLAKAREVADKITFDWREPVPDGEVTALAWSGDVCEYAVSDSPAEALAGAVEKLRAYRAGGAR
jgi:excisionase family DNA binding protein